MSQTPPPGQNTVSPYLAVEGATDLIQFIEKVFHGKQRMLMPGEDGIVMHAEMTIGESVIMLSDSCEHAPVSNATLHIYVEDVDKSYQRALASGATSGREPADQFYGDRTASVLDPFGNTWHIATQVEDLTPEQFEKRLAEMMEKNKGG